MSNVDMCEHDWLGSGCKECRAEAMTRKITAPSGTPEIPVKAYYHEAPNEHGGLNKSVGLEVRKEFADAPLVLESDALAGFAAWDARVAALEAAYVRAGEREHALRAELAAIKAQEPAFMWHKGATEDESEVVDVDCACPCCVPLYAATVSEAKAQGVVMPERKQYPSQSTYPDGEEFSAACGEVQGFNRCLDEVARLNAAPVQQVSVPQCVFDWFEAKQAHVNAVDAYNARLAFVREHMPFGTSIDPEYKIMEAADRKAQTLIGAMFSGLRDLAAAPAAPAADAGLVEAFTTATNRLDRIALELTGHWANEATDVIAVSRAAIAAHRAKGVV